jgi:hypothetical protein
MSDSERAKASSKTLRTLTPLGGMPVPQKHEWNKSRIKISAVWRSPRFLCTIYPHATPTRSWIFFPVVGKKHRVRGLGFVQESHRDTWVGEKRRRSRARRWSWSSPEMAATRCQTTALIVVDPGANRDKFELKTCLHRNKQSLAPSCCCNASQTLCLNGSLLLLAPPARCVCCPVPLYAIATHWKRLG